MGWIVQLLDIFENPARGNSRMPKRRQSGSVYLPGFQPKDEKPAQNETRNRSFFMVCFNVMERTFCFKMGVDSAICRRSPTLNSRFLRRFQCWCTPLFRALRFSSEGFALALRSRGTALTKSSPGCAHAFGRVELFIFNGLMARIKSVP